MFPTRMCGEGYKRPTFRRLNISRLTNIEQRATPRKGYISKDFKTVKTITNILQESKMAPPELVESKDNKKDVCRMAWYLIEVDQSEISHNKDDEGKMMYGIIHWIELIDKDYPNIYVDKLVRFNWNHAIVKGKVRLASDDRHYVEGHLQALTSNKGEAQLRNNRERSYLLQFVRNSTTVVQRIVYEQEILWPSDLQDSNCTEVMISDDGNINRIARIVDSDLQHAKLQKQLARLKDDCFQKVSRA